MKYVSFPWSPLDAALSILNASLFVNNIFFFWDESNKNKGDCYQCRIISFQKMCHEMILSVAQ
jgi:hypothetical protein